MLRSFGMLVEAFLVAILCINLHHWGSNINIFDEVYDEYFISWRNVAVRNAGALKGTDTLILVIHGYYDGVVTSNEYKVSKYDTMVVSFVKETTGLLESARELSSLIDNVYSLLYNKIIVVGISKGGCMTVEMTKYLKTRKVAFINIDSPYEGTLLATPEEMKKKCMEMPLMGKVFWEIYSKVFAWSAVDRDIALGAEFLKQLDYSKVKDFTFINVMSTCGYEALVKDIFRFNPQGISCFFINWLLDLEGDGIVPNSSKEKINPYANKVIKIQSSHSSAYRNVLEEAIKSLK